MIQRNTGKVEAEVETATRRLAGHLRYLQYTQRSLREQRADRGLFSATRNQLRLSEALAAVLGAECGYVVWDKLLLAPEEGEPPVRDYRAWTRKAMQGVAEQWVGVLHQNTPITHVHVVFVEEQASSPRVVPMAWPRTDVHRPSAIRQPGSRAPLRLAEQKESR